ncbi:hypothetical protein BDK51DRAFT_44289 [Blyttiomyces helicus]|uniref:Uncharacterized protein n=1 Tax=Blyttiomyces helicus TaxID=388810 RepID=A0A4P9W9U9_9FUNG|nr:hypothetical protein BDK51DRAFT_44289 [Blyttiomyces helicus]|eukprot:RKO89341.1 hypothetical protein BDK51DRAFT_44289 [Blyttiomyces helicus]
MNLTQTDWGDIEQTPPPEQPILLFKPANLPLRRTTAPHAIVAAFSASAGPTTAVPTVVAIARRRLRALERSQRQWRARRNSARGGRTGDGLGERASMRRRAWLRCWWSRGKAGFEKDKAVPGLEDVSDSPHFSFQLLPSAALRVFCNLGVGNYSAFARHTQSPSVRRRKSKHPHIPVLPQRFATPAEFLFLGCPTDNRPPPIPKIIPKFIVFSGDTSLAVEYAARQFLAYAQAVKDGIERGAAAACVGESGYLWGEGLGRALLKIRPGEEAFRIVCALFLTTGCNSEANFQTLPAPGIDIPQFVIAPKRSRRPWPRPTSGSVLSKLAAGHAPDPPNPFAVPTRIRD